mgnify:CR=1 FL=1
MANSVYLASSEAKAGKAAVALGLLNAVTALTHSVGVFRPIVRSREETDHVLDMLVSRLGGTLSYEDAAGVDYDMVHADPAAAMSTIVDRYYKVAERFAAMLIVGSDFTDVATPTEFSFNAEVAANIDAPMIVVVGGLGRSPEEIRTTAELAVNDARVHHAHVVGVIANRVAEEDLEQTRAELAGIPALHGRPTYALPATMLLDAPTVRELLDATNATLIYGDEPQLDRSTNGVMVGAMTLPNVLDRLYEGAVVVTPGDRADVLMGVLMANTSANYPSISAMVLNGGFPVPPQVERLLDGLGGVTIPVMTVDTGTMATVDALSKVRGRLTKDADRKIQTAISLFESNVDGPALFEHLIGAEPEAVTPLMFEHLLLDRARKADKHIVLPEGEEPRILRAADALLRRQVVRLTLLGDPATIRTKATLLGLDISAADVIDPQTSELRERFAEEYAQLRAKKGVTLSQANDIVVDSSYFGTMMVLDGLADGMVSGSINTTAHTIRPALEVIKTVPGTSIVSSVFLMCLADRVLAYGDCAVNPDPNPEQLADIAISSAKTARQFGIEPRVAMLSYSTGSSGTGADVDKVRAATEIVRQRDPELLVEGPIQYDAAVDLDVAQTKLKDSAVAGRATVLIFPDLNTGNNTYKAVQRSAGAVAIGPVLQGLRKPVNDLSRGALVSDIINTVAITAIQAASPPEDTSEGNPS